MLRFAGSSRALIAFILALTCIEALAENGWTTIPGGAGTGCAALQSPYELYVRAGDPRKVAVYFQGGGGCWNDGNCGLSGRETFDAIIEEAGAGGYRSARISGLMIEWGATTALKHDPLYRDLELSTANFENLYIHAAKTPNLRLSQINSAGDGVQVFFLGQLGHTVTALPPLLSGNLRQLRAANPDLRTYTMPGTVTRCCSDQTSTLRRLAKRCSRNGSMICSTAAK